MDTIAMKEKVLGLVQERGGSVSFADLTMRIPDFGGGEYGIPYPRGENIVVWQGMSEAGARAVSELVTEFKIVIRPTSPMIYMIDGMMPELPVATKERAYKKPHWLPMVIDLDARA